MPGAGGKPLQGRLQPDWFGSGGEDSDSRKVRGTSQMGSWAPFWPAFSAAQLLAKCSSSLGIPSNSKLWVSCSWLTWGGVGLGFAAWTVQGEDRERSSQSNSTDLEREK